MTLAGFFRRETSTIISTLHWQNFPQVTLAQMLPSKTATIVLSKTGKITVKWN